MFPIGLTINVRDDMIIWKNRTGKITHEEAIEVSEKITQMVTEKKYHTLVVDNSKLCGVWSTDVDKVWVDLMSYLPQHVDKTVTICENIINKLQINYLSKQAGTQATAKAFVSTETSEINNFLDFDLSLH